MTYNRASKGNISGIEAVAKASDPFKKKLIILKESQIKKLKQLAFDSSKSDSELVREALDKYF